MQISGASAVVTGGAGGLGEATTRALVAAGASVVIADFSEEKGAALAAELSGSATFVKTDVTSEESMQAAIDAATAMGPLRVLVTAHGGFALAGRLVNRSGEALGLEGFRKTVDVYLTGTYNAMRLAAAAMSATEPAGESGRGVIITTASIAAMEGQVGQVPYAAAKGGVTSMALVAARDLAVTGIRVVCIAPGTFFTPAFMMPEADAQERFGQGIPFPARMGRASEYATLVQSIVDNDYLNGTVIRLDAALRFGLK